MPKLRTRNAAQSYRRRQPVSAPRRLTVAPDPIHPLPKMLPDPLRIRRLRQGRRAHIQRSGVYCLSASGLAPYRVAPVADEQKTQLRLAI